MEQRNAEIIAVGTEILLGEITDTNSVFIARALRDIGLNLYYMTSVGDNEQRIADVIRVALSRAHVVITCGGLGPTIDDMTRQAVAAATNRGLTFHPDLLEKIAERFAGFRTHMTENNRRQAFLPDEAVVIENPVGTAPAFIVECEDRSVISLPGVPREMKYLMTERVVPYLRQRFDLGNSIIKARVLRTAGIGESTLDARIGPDLLQQSNPTVGLAAHTGQVDIRITAKASDVETAEKMIADVETLLRERIGAFIFGVDAEQIEAVLVQLLIEHNSAVALIESGIDNAVSRRIDMVEQGGKVLALVQTYTTPDEIRQVLALPENISLRELAEQAAKFVCHKANAAAGIAVISRPEMDEYHADIESGTAIAVYTPQISRSRVYGFGGQSDVAPLWASTWSLSMLWQIMKERFETV